MNGVSDLVSHVLDGSIGSLELNETLLGLFVVANATVVAERSERGAQRHEKEHAVDEAEKRGDHEIDSVEFENS